MLATRLSDCATARSGSCDCPSSTSYYEPLLSLGTKAIRRDAVDSGGDDGLWPSRERRHWPDRVALQRRAVQLRSTLVIHDGSRVGTLRTVTALRCSFGREGRCVHAEAIYVKCQFLHRHDVMPT